MRLLEVSKKMHGGKAELSTKTISGMYFRCKSQMEKIKVVAQGGGSRLSCGSYLGGSLLRHFEYRKAGNSRKLEFVTLVQRPFIKFELNLMSN